MNMGQPITDPINKMTTITECISCTKHAIERNLGLVQSGSFRSHFPNDPINHDHIKLCTVYCIKLVISLNKIGFTIQLFLFDCIQLLMLQSSSLPSTFIPISPIVKTSLDRNYHFILKQILPRSLSPTPYLKFK